jgi:hypothetical protein
MRRLRWNLNDRHLGYDYVLSHIPHVSNIQRSACLMPLEVCQKKMDVLCFLIDEQIYPSLLLGYSGFAFFDGYQEQRRRGRSRASQALKD